MTLPIGVPFKRSHPGVIPSQAGDLLLSLIQLPFPENPHTSCLPIQLHNSGATKPPLKWTLAIQFQNKRLPLEGRLKKNLGVGEGSR
jgi:hypothetical protein